MPLFRINFPTKRIIASKEYKNMAQLYLFFRMIFSVEIYSNKMKKGGQFGKITNV